MASLWSWFTGDQGERAPESAQGATMTLEELTETHEIAHVDETPGQQFAVAVPKTEALTRESGSSSPSPWTSFTRQEYNPQLQGLRGLEMYDKMRKSDGTVRGTLRAIKTPALAGTWFIEPAPCDEDDEEMKALYQKQADFVWRNLTEMMSIPFGQVLSEALLMCDFGSYIFETVWEFRKVDGQMRTVLSKLAPRHPMDVKEWRFDRHGGPVRVDMYKTIPTTGTLDYIPISINKLLVFTFDRESGNIEGIPVLRSAYKHWYFKEQLYKIDAIQKERHGIGIPVIKLPLGYKDDDKKAAEELGRNIRTNERAHIVLPPGWEIAMLKLEGQPVDALKSVEHHDEKIRENILVNFVAKGAQDADLAMFLKASRIVADIVADSFNTYLIWKMVKFNWPDTERMPKLKVRRIGENADWRTLSFAVRNLIGSGVIIPDETLEKNLREEMDLPAIDKESARLIATPQNPYDINEDVDDGEEGDEQEAEGDQTHNNNSPLYNRNRKKIRRGVKQAGPNRAGLPRQTPPSQGRGAFGMGRAQGGSDRTGG